MADIGRPTVMTPETLRKLEEAFALGCTDLEACTYADISKSTLYDYQQEHPEFVERKELLKENPILLARKSVVEALANDPDLSLRYLERKKKDEFSPRSELTGKDGNDLLPIPILASLNVYDNNGDQEDSQTPEADQGSTGGDISQQDNLDTSTADTPSTVGQDPNPDERSVGVSSPPEAGGDAGLHEDHEGAAVLEAE